MTTLDTFMEISKNNGTKGKSARKYVHLYHVRMKHLSKLGPRGRNYFLNLAFNDIIKEIEHNFDGDLKTFLRNIITSIHRDNLKKLLLENKVNNRTNV